MSCLPAGFAALYVFLFGRLASSLFVQQNAAVSVDSAPVKDAAIVYIRWGNRMWEQSEHTVAMSALYFHPDASVVMLTDNKDELKKYAKNETQVQCGDSSQLQVFNVEDFREKDSREVEFNKNYVHSSRNPEAMEKGCIQRFFWLRAYMKASGVGRVLFADGDILFADDVFKRYQLTRSVPFFTLYPESTFFTYWSAEVLDDFCNYINDFYARPKQELFSDIEKYGSHTVHNVVAPVGWTYGLFSRQFSDMYIFREFLRARPALKAFVKYEDLPHEGMHTVDEALHKVNGVLGNTCRQFNGSEWVTEQVQGRQLNLPFVNGTKLVGVHFQGYCKDLIEPMFASMGLPCNGTVWKQQARKKPTLKKAR